MFPGETFQSQLGTTYDSFHRVNYAIMGSTVDTTLTIPSSGSARNAQRWIIHVFRGVDATTPLDVTSTYATGTGTGRPNPAAITPVTAGAWIMAFYASAAATGTAYTAPTDFATDWLGGTTADTADCMAGAGYYTGWTSGSYDPAAITAGGTTGAADAWTATTIALRPALPALTQAAFRMYADGTESGSTALAAQDANYTADVSSGDFNMGLRVRLQETNGNPGDSTDDYQLQYELNDSGTYYNIGSGATATYYFDGSDAAATDPNSVWTNDANAFDSSSATFATTTTAGSVSSNYLMTEGTNAPSSGGVILLVRARVKANIQGSYTNLSQPSGGWTWAKLQALEVKVYDTHDAETGFQYAAVYTDGLSELLGTATSAYGGSYSGSDIYIVELEVTSAPVTNFASTNLTDGGATTNRLGSGTGSFVAGEVSEDGLVDDLQITASNYTELLYSLTLVSSALANNDTLDFRVLRNGAVLDTYTVTPRVTASKSANYSGTPGIATLTLTAQTPTVTVSDNKAVTTASPTSLTLTAQTPTVSIGTVITTASPTALTTSPQAPTVTATDNKAITLASPTTLTTSLWTPTVAFTDNKAITLASPTALSLTLYEPTATVTNDQNVTPGTASLTLTAQTPSASLSDNKDAVPGTAFLTLTAQTPTVSQSDNKSITLASPTAIVISPQTPTVKLDNRVTPGIIALTTANQTPTASLSDNKFVTPGIGSLTLAAQTPTVTATANVAVTPGNTSLTTTNWTPTVAATDNKEITLASPTSLTLSPQTPTVSATNNIAVTPGTASLVTSTFSIGVAVSSSSSLTPGTASLTLAPQTPTVSFTANVAVTPGTASLTVTPNTPSAVGTDNKSVTTASPTALSLTAYAPTVSATTTIEIIPGTASLTLTAQTPTVLATNHIELTPGVAAMLTAMFAPDVAVGNNQFVTPGTASLRLRSSYPIVNGQVRERDYYIDSNGSVYWVISAELGLVEKV